MSCFALTREKDLQLNDNQPILFFDKNHTLNAIKLQIEIGNVGILALVDTGAEVSVMSDIVFASLNPLLVKQLSLETNNLTTASQSNHCLELTSDEERLKLQFEGMKSSLSENRKPDARPPISAITPSNPGNTIGYTRYSTTTSTPNLSVNSKAVHFLGTSHNYR